MIETTLKKIGFTQAETAVYLALLELGPSTTGRIVSKSRTANSKIYEVLEKLMRMGVVSYIVENDKRVYQAASPDRLLAYMAERQAELEKQTQELAKILPSLKLKHDVAGISEAMIYQGYKGLATAFMDAIAQMKPGQSICVMGVPDISEISTTFFAKWNRERARRGIRMRITFDQTARGKRQTLPENLPLAQKRYLPNNVFTPAAVNIFTDRVIINIVERGHEPLLILIMSATVAASFRAQFDLQWKTAR